MAWTVQLAKDAVKQLESQPRNQPRRLLGKLKELAEDPFQGDVLPLKGKKWQGWYHKRVGRYRVIFFPHQSENII
jgi:mRNA-degrading endonuclease RelE of RelBE toxin-antitoxin system